MNACFKKSIVLLMILSVGTPQVFGDKLLQKIKQSATDSVAGFVQKRAEKKAEKKAEQEAEKPKKAAKKAEKRAKKEEKWQSTKCANICKPKLENYIDREVDEIVAKLGTEESPEIIDTIKLFLKALYKPRCKINEKGAKIGTAVATIATAGGLAMATGGVTALVSILGVPQFYVSGAMQLFFRGRAIKEKEIKEIDIKDSPIVKEFLTKHKMSFNIKGGDTKMEKVLGTRCWGFVKKAKTAAKEPDSDTSDDDFFDEE